MQCYQDNLVNAKLPTKIQVSTSELRTVTNLKPNLFFSQIITNFKTLKLGN